MVDMEVVRERLLKGAYVGVGSFASSFVGQAIEDNTPLGDIETAVAQAALGAGMSVGVDEVFDDPSSMPNDAVEFAGYGLQGAAWSQVAEDLMAGGSQSGFTADRVVEVNASADDESDTTNRNQTGKFSIDTV